MARPIGRACTFSGAVAAVTLAGVAVFASMTGWASALAQTELPLPSRERSGRAPRVRQRITFSC
jgi:hypothetical protein